jgi:hypothetical protein
LGSCHDEADVPYPEVPAHILHPHSTPGPKNAKIHQERSIF